MITNFETNKVYFAKGMTTERYVDAAGCLLGTLHNYNIPWNFLQLTTSPLHIWARDYMPVQVSKEKFVRFNYSPDYLKDYPNYKPDTSAILSALGIHVISSDIIMDGGNVVSCGDKVIMTDKIFRENPHHEHNVLIDALSQLLEAEIVLIPEDAYDEYGHADGMVRYMGEGRVLLNNYFDFDKALRKRIFATLRPHFEITELHYGTYTDRSWAYLNFLHVGHHIFIPMMEDKLGETAFKQIADAFPQCKCHPIHHCESIVREGGALNCSTWNILVDLPSEETSQELPKKV
ncbi:MAG: agmatine deiminase family protein [Bacteroidaceae bacterium]|nr:agmatine deiminase family protein [Bacteroidaceae bacterium]